jgi:L-ribulokinase
MYRALQESLCFGTRRILETHTQGGVAVHEILVTSGLAEKAPFMVDLMAQVTGRPVTWPEVREPTARGAAIHGAVAAGVVADFEAAIAHYGARRARRVEPDDAAGAVYDRLYAHYCALSGYMAGSGIMPELRSLRAQVR